MKHIYLCGPLPGRDVINTVERFDAAETRIRRAAINSSIEIHTSNPMRFCPPDFDWYQTMRTCVGELARCGGIALLKGWQWSKGAATELELAEKLHIPVVYIEQLIGYDDLPGIFAAAPETLRYYNARLLQLQKEGAEENLAEDRALAELANRYLDPHGFEYISIEEGK